MNSPDMTRLAAALAKLDDPDIIELLLEAYRPTPATPAAPQPEPIQHELLGHIQDRRKKYQNQAARRAGAPWRGADIMQLRALLTAGHDLEHICNETGRSRKSIQTAIRRYIDRDPRYSTWRSS